MLGDSMSMDEVMKVYRIMRKIASISEVPTTLIAEIAQLPYHKVIRILATLERMGLVEKRLAGRGYVWRAKIIMEQVVP